MVQEGQFCQLWGIWTIILNLTTRSRVMMYVLTKSAVHVTAWFLVVTDRCYVLGWWPLLLTDWRACCACAGHVAATWCQYSWSSVSQQVIRSAGRSRPSHLHPPLPLLMHGRSFRATFRFAQYSYCTSRPHMRCSHPGLTAFGDWSSVNLLTWHNSHFPSFWLYLNRFEPPDSRWTPIYLNKFHPELCIRSCWRRRDWVRDSACLYNAVCNTACYVTNIGHSLIFCNSWITDNSAVLVKMIAQEQMLCKMIDHATQ
jgi:hypothetical protein